MKNCRILAKVLLPILENLESTSGNIVEKSIAKTKNTLSLTYEKRRRLKNNVIMRCVRKSIYFKQLRAFSIFRLY